MAASLLVSALERVGSHDHLCSIYETEADRVAVALPFLRIGLGRGEKCVYVVDSGGEQAMAAALQADGVDVERMKQSGALVLRSGEATYLRSGRFEPEDMFDFWRKEAAGAADAGFSAMRGAGETDWVARTTPGVLRWLEYESRLTEVMAQCNCVMLCQYNRALYPPDLIARVIQTHPLVVYDGIICANHYHVPASEFLQPGQDERQVRRLLASLRDRGRVEERLRRSEAYLAEGQKISHTGSWAWNAASGEMFWSAEHFRIFGLEPGAKAPDYEAVLARVHAEDRAALRAAFDTAVRNRSDYSMKCRVVRPDGSLRYVESRARPVLDSAGNLVEYIGTIVDETERQQAEEAVQKARAELAHVSRALTVSELAASIAHELNQPLAAVVANASACERWLAARPPNEAEAHAALRRITRDATRAGEVIHRLRALLMHSAPQKVELRLGDLIADVMSLVEGEARDKGIALTSFVEEDVIPLRADRIQLQQVLLNLVLNAIEALGASSGPRTVEVRARLGDAGAVVAVSDSGRGLDPQCVERVFEAFFSTKREGMGMGLAICRSIVEAHGGQIHAGNNGGGGATFEFTLPF
jgi:signal transduction histidine kinase